MLLHLFSDSVTDLELSPLLCFQISLGLITAKATHVVYPRWKRLESVDVSDGRVIKEQERLNIWTLATFGWIVICSNDSVLYVTDVLLSVNSLSDIQIVFDRKWLFCNSGYILQIKSEHFCKLLHLWYVINLAFFNYVLFYFASYQSLNQFKISDLQNTSEILVSSVVVGRKLMAGLFLFHFVVRLLNRRFSAMVLDW